MKPPNEPRMFNLQFFLLCLSSFLFFGSFNMIIPELPGYLKSLGGEKYIGLIIAIFTLTAGISRPFSGKLADTVGRIPVMIFGAMVCFFIGFLYPVMTSVAGFFLLRFIHGFSTGFKPTGTSAYIADIVPFNRRGEAMGIMGISGSLGIAIGPWIGGEIANAFSLDAMFYASSVSALLSILILIGMKETLTERHRFSLKLLRIQTADVYEPLVFAPSLVMMLTAFPFGIVLTLIPDMSEMLGFENKGVFYIYLTIASVLVRVFAGKASDKYGRANILRFSTLMLAGSSALVAFSDTQDMFIISSIITGLAVGMNTPAIFAWTVDLSDVNHRGRAMSTMYIALEIGIGLGALISGFVYGNNLDRLPIAILLGSFTCFAAFVYIQFIYKPVVSDG